MVRKVYTTEEAFHEQNAQHDLLKNCKINKVIHSFAEKNEKNSKNIQKMLDFFAEI